MYRARVHLTVHNLAGWNEALNVAHGMNAIATRLGQPTATVWTETVGQFNHLVVEVDYESLADFEASNRALFQDPEWPALMSRLEPILVEGKGYTELLEHAVPAGN
jgi:NIPSNAP